MDTTVEPSITEKSFFLGGPGFRSTSVLFPDFYGLPRERGTIQHEEEEEEEESERTCNNNIGYYDVISILIVKEKL